MSILGVGPLVSTAVVAAIGIGEAFDRPRLRCLAQPSAASVQHGRPIDPRPHLDARQSIPQDPVHSGSQRHSDATPQLE
jgi:hypothetical protein